MGINWTKNPDDQFLPIVPSMGDGRSLLLDRAGFEAPVRDYLTDLNVLPVTDGNVVHPLPPNICRANSARHSRRRNKHFSFIWPSCFDCPEIHITMWEDMGDYVRMYRPVLDCALQQCADRGLYVPTLLSFDDGTCKRGSLGRDFRRPHDVAALRSDRPHPNVL